jgi:hypothetical protein
MRECGNEGMRELGNEPFGGFGRLAAGRLRVFEE